MSAKANTEQRPDSGVQKYTKKLEGENRALKARDGHISFSSSPVEIDMYDKNKEEEIFFVLSGQGGKTASIKLAIHRSRGQDWEVPPNSWCVSNVECLKQFDSNREHPGKQKIMKDIAAIKLEHAYNPITGIADEGTHKFSVYHSEFRSEQLDKAKTRRATYGNAIGKKPNAVCFMDSVEQAKLEVSFQNLTIDPTVMAKCKPFYIKEAMHRPKTMSGLAQVSAKYLYGIDGKNVMQKFYHHLQGVESDIQADAYPVDYPVIDIEIPLLTDINWSNKEIGVLNDLLDEHTKLLKEKNILKAEATALKKKGTKEQKTSAQSAINLHQEAIVTSADLIKAANIDFADTMFTGIKFTLVSRNDIKGYNPSLQVAGSKKKKETSSSIESSE